MENGFMRDLDGEDDDVAQAWMRDFTKYVTTATISVSQGRLGEVKASVFAAHIAQGTEAETWYQGLTQAQRDSWANIVIQFNLKWPPRAAIPKTIKEYIEEFKACTLMPDEMLARIPTGVGTSMQWGYAAFADRIRRSGSKTSLPVAALLIDIKEQVPPVLVKLMIPHANAVTWADWCDALKGLDPELIQAEQAVFQRLSALEKEAESQRAQTESDRARTAVTPRVYAPKQPQYVPQPQYAPQQQYRPPQNQFQTTQQSGFPPAPPPPTPNMFAATPPPRTPQNVARVEQERQEWAGRFPDRIPYPSRAYPLTPGTASALVGCARCGEPETSSHNGFKCTNPPLEELEQRYRGNVKRTPAHRLNAYASPAQSYSGPQTPSPVRGSPWRGRGGFRSPSSPSPLQYMAAHHSQDGNSGYEWDVQQIEEEEALEVSDAPHDEESGNGGEVL